MYEEKIFGFYAVAASSLAALLLRRLHFTDAFMRHVLVSVCVYVDCFCDAFECHQHRAQWGNYYEKYMYGWCTSKTAEVRFDKSTLVESSAYFARVQSELYQLFS